MSRPQFQPTPEHRKLVVNLAACGVPQDKIAQRIGLRSPKTLRRHFRKELERGGFDANVNVISTLYNMAVSGTNTAATLFWIKCRSHWKEGSEFDRSPLPPPFIVTQEPIQ